MKMRQFLTALAALVMMCWYFTVSTAKADDPTVEAPAFSARIEYSSQGYIVKGTFTEFPPDIRRAETLYSLDGETYQSSGEEWHITNWSDGPWTDWDEAMLEKFQNQTCLHSNTEPLKSYLAGKLDCFYVKLRLTRENGITYNTQAAVIERGASSPVPEEMTPIAGFAPSLRVKTFRPFSYYGRYEITVSEDATDEEISAFLPDTLPIQIDLLKGIDAVANGIIDCPVTWKPLSNLRLTAGESVTIPDAAEEIVIAAGTVLDTPLGGFQLNEALGINQHGMNDEVRLVLNVIEKGSSPSGALACDFNGLDVAFHQKPTGATAIRAYTLSEGDTEWTELLNPPLLEAVNSQPSTASSGYAYVLDNTHELYQSYMAAQTEGREPTPFFIGLKIEGGVYDGQQLILAWPDTYDLPLDLPKLGGSGGNEDNAGANNKGDATDEGQRPKLPQDTEGDGQLKTPSQNTGGEGQPSAPSQNTDGAGQQSAPSQNTNVKVDSVVPLFGNSGMKKTQNKSEPQIADGYDTAPQTSTTMQDAEGTTAKESTPLPTSPKNAGSGAPAKGHTPMPRLAAFTLIIVVLCIAGLFIAATVRKRTMQH